MLIVIGNQNVGSVVSFVHRYYNLIVEETAKRIRLAALRLIL